MTLRSRIRRTVKTFPGDAHGFKFEIAATDSAHHFRRGHNHPGARFPRGGPGNMRDRHQHAGIPTGYNILQRRKTAVHAAARRLPLAAFDFCCNSSSILFNTCSGVAGACNTGLKPAPRTEAMASFSA